jgi:hypothetical protein
MKDSILNLPLKAFYPCMWEIDLKNKHQQCNLPNEIFYLSLPLNNNHELVGKMTCNVTRHSIVPFGCVHGLSIHTSIVFG